ncbi:MAG: hypothetical protein HYV07_26245 [Deltaproteobacteria bacterium]|nr:hypothetical protein [Deltaproteobacteria bacterium]
MPTWSGPTKLARDPAGIAACVVLAAFDHQHKTFHAGWSAEDVARFSAGRARKVAVLAQQVSNEACPRGWIAVLRDVSRAETRASKPTSRWKSRKLRDPDARLGELFERIVLRLRALELLECDRAEFLRDPAEVVKATEGQAGKLRADSLRRLHPDGVMVGVDVTVGLAEEGRTWEDKAWEQAAPAIEALVRIMAGTRPLPTEEWPGVPKTQILSGSTSIAVLASEIAAQVRRLALADSARPASGLTREDAKVLGLPMPKTREIRSIEGALFRAMRRAIREDTSPIRAPACSFDAAVFIRACRSEKQGAAFGAAQCLIGALFARTPETQRTYRHIEEGTRRAALATELGRRGSRFLDADGKSPVLTAIEWLRQGASEEERAALGELEAYARQAPISAH